MKTTSLAALAAVAAALASPALAAPTKISSCPKVITQPGLYEVQDNLDSVGTCITVRTDSVTIDLGGYRIRGDGTGSAVFAQGGGFFNTTVRNGTVMNFRIGIDLMSGSVDNVSSLNNTNAGILVATGAIRNSRAEGNTNQYGIVISTGSTVTGNVVVGNLLGILASPGSIVHGNAVFGNAQGGIVSGSPGASITNNSVMNNGSWGIMVTCPSLLLANTVLNQTSNMALTGVGCKDEHNVTQ